MSHATTGKYSSTIVPELAGMEAIKRYEKDKGIDWRKPDIFEQTYEKVEWSNFLGD